MFKLIKTFEEFNATYERADIKTLCTITDEYPEEIASFETLNEAMAALKNENYKPSCRYDPYHRIYEVTEYSIMEEESEDGEDYTAYHSYYEFEFDDEANDIVVTTHDH